MTLNRSRAPKKRSGGRPKGSLALLLLLIAALFGGIAATTVWAKPEGQWTPKLGLDLEGGRQIVLQPVTTGSQQINSEQVDQAVSIIRKRVDSSGVAEAEVTTLGAQNIIVSLPGQPSKEMLDSLAQSSQLTFRPVIGEMSAAGQQQPQPQPQPQPSLPGPRITPSAQPSGAPSQPAPTASPPQRSGSQSGSAAPRPSATGANGAFPQAFPADTPTPSPTGSRSPDTDKAPSTSPKAGSTKSPKPSSSASPSRPVPDSKVKPKDGSDQAWAAMPVNNAWVKAKVVKKGATYEQLASAYKCTSAAHQRVAANQPNNLPLVACDEQGAVKYLMGPVEVSGDMVSNATSGPATNNQGQATGGVVVNLEFDDRGKKAFGDMTTRLNRFPQDQPQNKSSIIVDGRVISAPSTRGPITAGQAQISGNFTESSGKLLADQLKFGALPFSFTELTNDQISPQLGQDQLTKGLLAGAVGLALVVLYSLYQYRALGMVTVMSLVVAGILVYGAVVLLGHTNNFRLSMAGITGLIVSIGFTADSFIVYFERVRDEVRSGRPLRAAVETGWARARRTVLISDVVNFIAAAVLYVLSESNVKAFAFTLGLTTIIDIVVVFLFTHPMLALLARTKFFGGGHKLSGFDSEHLGAKGVTYAGRGRVTIADRRAAAEGGQI